MQLAVAGELLHRPTSWCVSPTRASGSVSATTSTWRSRGPMPALPRHGPAAGAGVATTPIAPFEVVVGRYPIGHRDGGPSFPTFPATSRRGLPSELLERRPDVIAAERRVAAAFYRVGEAKAARLPRISLTSGINAHLERPVRAPGSRQPDLERRGQPAGAALPRRRAQDAGRDSHRRADAGRRRVRGHRLAAFGDVEEALATELAMRDRERHPGHATGRQPAGARHRPGALRHRLRRHARRPAAADRAARQPLDAAAGPGRAARAADQPSPGAGRRFSSARPPNP